MVQNTPTGCGNDLPILLGNLAFDHKSVFICIILYFVCMLGQIIGIPIRVFATWSSPGIPIRTCATWNSDSGSHNLLQGSNLLNPCLKYPTNPTPYIQTRTFATWNSNSGSRNQIQVSNLLNPCLKYPTLPTHAPPLAWGRVGQVFEARSKQIAALK